MTLLGVRATARRLGVHENTVRNWAKDGFIHPATRKPDGSFMRFEETEVNRVWLKLQQADGLDCQEDPADGATVGVLVRLRDLPPGMSPAQAVREVAVSVRFGKPEVRLYFVRRKPRDVS
jgi:hypothetical protein